MAQIGYGYGSEWHLLRYLGRHRNLLDDKVLKVVGGSAIRWLDFGFRADREWPDSELVRLDFLPELSPAKTSWSTAWPRSGTPITWDAVGQVSMPEGNEWLLVEAKANLEEMKTSTGASYEGGRHLIEETLDRTKCALGVPADANWVDGSYQLANRIAALHHLNSYDEPARLLLIYLCSDRTPGKTCPTDRAGWEAAIEVHDARLRLPKGHPFGERIHRLFLDVHQSEVRPRPQGDRFQLPGIVE